MTAATFTTANLALDLLYLLLNGISEVTLLSSPSSSLLILAGVMLASRKAGFMMLISGLIGAAVAFVLGAPLGTITLGLFGYNSILTGMALWSGPFTKSTKVTFVLSIVGAAVTAVAWQAFAHVLGDIFSGLGAGYGLPGLSSSFIFTTWVIMYASKRYGYDIWPVLPPRTSQAQTATFKWTAKEFIHATLNGLSQITFIENWRTGLFWIAALTFSFELAPASGRTWTNAFTAGWNPGSPLFLAGFMAFLGSAIGAALAIAAKLPVAEVRSGLHGFNQALVVIAITSFLPLTSATFAYAIFGAVACSLFAMPALQNLFAKSKLPALTGPFVFTAWIFLLAVIGFGNIPGGIGWAKP